MSWIVVSLLMFTTSAVMYLLIRKGQKQGITTTVNSMAMFVIPVPLLVAYAYFTHSSLIVSWWQLFLLVLSSFFFSWLGNLFSLKAIESSPNPGYSLIISKSYVVFTALASIFLFNSPLPWQSVVGIGLILFFSAVIMLADKKKSQHVDSLKWVWLSLGAFFCWGGLALISKYLLNEGVSVAARLFYVFLFVSIILLIEVWWRQEKLVFSQDQWLLLFIIGLMGMFFNLFMQIGFQLAPNPGFVNAVNAASIVLVTLLAAYFFNDELNLKKFLGVVGVMGGLLFLFL